MPIGRIQREARGILPFLDIVGQTARPIALEDNVRGVIDLTDFYGANIFTREVASGTGQIVTNNVQLIVPQGEFWRVWAGHASLDTAVGETSQVSLNIIPLDGLFGRVCVSEHMTAVAALARNVAACTFGTPIVLPPGGGAVARIEDSNLAIARTLEVALLVQVFGTQ